MTDRDNGQGKARVLGAHVPDHVAKEFVRVAHQHDRSVSGHLRHLIRQHLADNREQEAIIA
jgi:hypothetical protein